jgi:hypothetical protein
MLKCLEAITGIAYFDVSKLELFGILYPSKQAKQSTCKRIIRRTPLCFASEALIILIFLS